MKGKRFLAGLLTAAMLVTSPAVTRAALVDDDLVNLDEIEQTEEPATTEEPVTNQAGKSGYETDWDKLKDEISNAISTFSLGDADEEPVVEDGALKADSGEYFGGDKVNHAIFNKMGRYRVNWIGALNYYFAGSNDNVCTYVKNGGKRDDFIKTYVKPAYDSTPNKNGTTQNVKKAAAKALGLKKKNGTGDPDKIYNSSTRELKQAPETSKIRKAFLVWQARTGRQGSYLYKENAYPNRVNTVALVFGDGDRAIKVKADATYADARPAAGCLTDKDVYEGTAQIRVISCLYADVTDFVKKNGYGDYSVCNIRPWDPDGNGGGSYAQWQLIVVEEDDSFPLSATKVQLGSYCADVKTAERADGWHDTDMDPITLKAPSGINFMSNMNATLMLGLESANGVYTKGVLNVGTAKKTINLYAEGRTSGLFQNGSSGRSDSPKYNNGLFAFYNSTVPKVNNKSVSSNEATVDFVRGDYHWVSYFLVGASVELPIKVKEKQVTEVTDATTGAFTVKNTGFTATSDQVGICNGTVTVTLDSKLTINKKADGNYDITTNQSGVTAKASGNTVTFTGVQLKRNDAKFVYEIKCTGTANSNDRMYYNSDSLKGYVWNRTDKKAVGTSQQWSEDESSVKWVQVGAAQVIYHLNAPNGEANQIPVSIGTAGIDSTLTEEALPNPAGQQVNAYSIRSYDDVGFSANDGYTAGLAGTGTGFYWTTGADGSGTRYNSNQNIYLEESEKVDLYAHWIPDSYGVVYDANGGTGNKLGSDGSVLPLKDGRPNTGVDKAYFGEDYALLRADSFQRPGYYFTGWNTQANGKGYHYEVGDTSKDFTGDANPDGITLYAEWEPVDHYEVQYVDGYVALEHNMLHTNFNTAEFYNAMENGQTITDEATVIKRVKKDEYKYQQDVKIPDIALKERAGYKLLGWAPYEALGAFVDADFGNIDRLRSDADTALERYLHTGTESDLNKLHRAVSSYNSAYDSYAEKLKRAGYGLYKTGRTFCCLPLGSNGCSYYQKADGTKVVTLCAVWVKDVKASIFYLPNTDGSDECVTAKVTQDCEYRKTTTLLQNQFKRSKHRFVNWKGVFGKHDGDLSGSEGTVADGGTIVPVTGITLLSAQWVVDADPNDSILFVSYDYGGSEQFPVLTEAERYEEEKKLSFSSSVSTESSTYSRDIVFPRAKTIRGWKFDGWVEKSYAEKYWKDNYVGLTEEGDSSTTSSSANKWSARNANKIWKAGTKMCFKAGTVFYAQYSRDNCVYFVQQKEIQKAGTAVTRGSFRINQYGYSKDKVTAPQQIAKDGWTAMGWTRNADCQADAECRGGDTIEVIGGDVYYGLYQKKITVSYDPNGYEPVRSMPSAQSETAYYTTAAWDKGMEDNYANAARQYVSNNTYLNTWFKNTDDAKDKRLATDRGYVFPSITVADLVPVYRKINERKTDVIPTHWSTEQKGSKVDTKTSEGWIDPYEVRVNCYAHGSYEFREDTLLYQQYKTVTLSDGEKIHHSVSILAKDKISIGSTFVTDKLSDTGRVYVSENHAVATVTQSGLITGVSDGVTKVNVYASDGKTEIGDCTVIVSTAAVTIPKVLRPGQYAEVGIEVRAGGDASITGNLSMVALSGLSGRNTGTVYKLNAFTRGKNSDYSLLGEGSKVVSATANKWSGGKASKSVDFKVETTQSLETLVPDVYDATVVWKLDLKLN